MAFRARSTAPGACSTIRTTPDLPSSAACACRKPCSTATTLEIRRWRREQQLRKTLANRPDLLEGATLSKEDRKSYWKRFVRNSLLKRLHRRRLILSHLAYRDRRDKKVLPHRGAARETPDHGELAHMGQRINHRPLQQLLDGGVHRLA